jgi:hypothetical protein
MLIIQVVHAGSHYEIDDMQFEDETGLIIYLRARGVTHENIMQALEELVREGACTIQQE